MKLVLAGKNPAARADELVAGTKLFDPAERKKLVEGGKAAIDASKDPMILLAKAMDAEARRLRNRHETEVEEPERQAYAALAKMRFKAFGKSVAPDATFTLRLAFGVVKGYEVGGETLPFHTTFGQAFEKSAQLGGKEPFDLPKRWLDGKGKARPLDAVQLRLDGGHHRRQFGQPRAQPCRRVGRHQLRPQPARAGAELRVHRRAGPAHRGPFAGGAGSTSQALPGRAAGQGTDREVISAQARSVSKGATLPC